MSFVDRIAGARIQSVRMGKALRWPLGCAPELLHGRVISTVRRRGKYLLVDMSEGILLLHLGMSGSLSFAPTQPPAGTHDHFDMLTSRGDLRLNDPRRFGAVVYASAEDDPVACKLLGRLGMEPLSDKFEAAVFHAALQRRQSPIKTVLLAGTIVVGVGNIYASEALFMARIRPTTLASAISRPRAVKLHSAIRQVLTRAVEQGGSTLRDFSNAQGEAGHFQQEAMVYDRANLPCKICGAPILMIRQGQRSTYFCMHCQRP